MKTMPGTLLFLAAAGLGLAEAPPGRTWEKPRLAAAQALYRSNCVVCHDVDEQKSQKVGPSFWHLFQREKMPMSSMKPNREYIKMRTRFGGALMPAFQKTLKAGTRVQPPAGQGAVGRCHRMHPGTAGRRRLSMRVFKCQACDNILYFENHTCERCGHRLAYMPEATALSSCDCAPATDGGVVRR